MNRWLLQRHQATKLAHGGALLRGDFDLRNILIGLVYVVFRQNQSAIEILRYRINVKVGVR